VSEDHVGLHGNQLLREHRKLVAPAGREAILYMDIAALNPSAFCEALPKSRRRSSVSGSSLAKAINSSRAASPQLAAQTRIISAARIRLDFRKSVRRYKGIICADVSELESHMPSQSVGSLGVMSRSRDFARHSRGLRGRWWVSVAHFSRFTVAFVEFCATVSGRGSSISVF
jgi:hypothetical protein